MAAFMGVASLVSFTWQTSLAGPLAGLLLGMWCGGAERGEEHSIPEHHGPERVHAVALAGWALCLLVVAGLEVLRSIGAEGVPLKGISLADAATQRLAEGDAAGAVELFREAERDVVSPEILHNHGAALAALGCWEEAVEVYRRWARCGILHDEALWNLSVGYEKTGRFSDAAECEEDRWRLYPRLMTDEQFYRLAVLHLQSGKVDASFNVVYLFLRATQKGEVARWTAEWDNLIACVTLAAGDTEFARQAFARALERNPDLESARRNLEALQP